MQHASSSQVSRSESKGIPKQGHRYTGGAHYCREDHKRLQGADGSVPMKAALPGCWCCPSAALCLMLRVAHATIMHVAGCLPLCKSQTLALQSRACSRWQALPGSRCSPSALFHLSARTAQCRRLSPRACHHPRSWIFRRCLHHHGNELMICSQCQFSC